jgi:hypothetical protein
MHELVIRPSDLFTITTRDPPSALELNTETGTGFIGLRELF